MTGIWEVSHSAITYRALSVVGYSTDLQELWSISIDSSWTAMRSSLALAAFTILLQVPTIASNPWIAEPGRGSVLNTRSFSAWLGKERTKPFLHITDEEHCALRRGYAKQSWSRHDKQVLSRAMPRLQPIRY